MADEPKTREEKVNEYRNTLAMVALCGRVLQQHDVPRLLADIERVGITGPLFNPTEWLVKSKAMEEDRELLQAALPLYEYARKMLAKVGGG